MILFELDMWAVGCIFAELLTLKPLFQGAEVKGTPNHFQVYFKGLTVVVLLELLNIISCAVLI